MEFIELLGVFIIFYVAIGTATMPIDSKLKTIINLLKERNELGKGK